MTHQDIARQSSKIFSDGFNEFIQAIEKRDNNMTLDDLNKLFKDNYPKAVDIAETEYNANKSAIDALAQDNGYRLAGIRLARAVFTTKQ